LSLGRAYIGSNYRNNAPLHFSLASAALQGREDVRANRQIDIPDCDRDIKDGLKGLSDIKAQGLAADKERHRLWAGERMHYLLRFKARFLGRNGGFARGRYCVELRLQLGFSWSELRVELSYFGC
jgi:hypothetical protein